SLSHILLLQADDYSDLQIKKFFKDTFEELRKDIRVNILGKEKLSKNIKSTLREYIETALDEEGGLNELRKLIIESYSKEFDIAEEHEIFLKMQLLFQQLANNIPIHLSKEKTSEGTLGANIISPILCIFFHDVSIHPTTWPNTSSSSAKVRKLANDDPTRAKQPDMIGNILNN
ncbi:14112_t:CDS:2, partial [Dentiscutata heterogama]